MSKFLFCLGLAALVSPVVYSASLPVQCALVLGHQRLLQNKIQFEKGETEEGLNRIALMKSSGKKIGILDYRFYSETNDLYIFEIEIKKKQRGKGYSTLLLARALKDNPTTKIITSKLSGDNNEILEKVLRKGKSIKEAIMNTPAYRARATLGFGQLPSYTDWDQMGFPVLRVSKTGM